jgi:malonyl-CoA/methylmalonyl-CoA synthetase
VTIRPWRDHLGPGDHLSVADLLSSGTLLAAWSRRWGEDPGARLWLEASSRAASGATGPGPARPTGSWWTAGEFDAATRRAAGRLRTAGLRTGDRVVWSTPSSVASLVAHVGALRAGLVVVPANPAYSERELAHIVSDVGAAAAIVDRAEQAEWVRRAAAGPVVVTGPGLDLPDGDPGPVDAASPDDPALICFTSGTTGVPKGAVLRHRNLLAATESVTAAWRWTAEDRLVHCLPIFHAHGLAVGVYGTLLAGGSAVLLPGFDPGAVAAAAEDHGTTLFFGVPTMYHRLVGSGQLGRLRGQRLCVSGSAPLPAGLHAAVTAASGIVVLERFGMTETLMNVSNPYEGERRAGTVGFPLPGVEVRLAGDGEILVRGPNVFDGYWERPQANAEAFVAADDAGRGGSPWFRTGDVGEESDGYLVIRGRTKELIISGGFNVYPGEVEDVLARHPAVAEVAVTGTASAEWGEVVTAWIVPDGPAPSVEELARFTQSTLAPYKRPRLVHVVDGLPRNALGKVVRSQLGT